MKDLTLVIMSAGMGSRFGGLKQIEPVGPNDEFIIDYSIYDAKKAGFNKVVFIIKKENYGQVDENGMFIDTKNFVRYLKDYEDKVNEININVSNCISLNLILKEYENYKHLDKFYFTYQYDFRGRIYPAQNHINTQGNDLMKESYKLLKENAEDYGFEFIGNIEGREAFSGEVDAIVTDGFTGNVFLKTAEGLGKFVKRTLTESFTKNLCTKLQYLVAKKPIKSMSKAMDYKSYGGALFLGVKKPVVKAHGSSDELLFEYTIIQAEKFVQNKAVPKMIEEFEKTKVMVK